MLDSIPYSQCPPLGLRVATTRVTAEYTTTTTGTFIDNAGRDHGLLKLHVHVFIGSGELPTLDSGRNTLIISSALSVGDCLRVSESIQSSCFP